MCKQNARCIVKRCIVKAVLAAFIFGFFAEWLYPQAAIAFDLPPGASLVPSGEWWKQPPQGLTKHNFYGQVTGVWNCVFWATLPPGPPINNTICGYISVFPVPEPAEPYRIADKIWMCVADTNILPYSAPFNKGGCKYYAPDKLPEDGFVPTAQDRQTYNNNLRELVDAALEQPDLTQAAPGRHRIEAASRYAAGNFAFTLEGISQLIGALAHALCASSDSPECPGAVAAWVLTPGTLSRAFTKIQPDPTDQDFQVSAGSAAVTAAGDPNFKEIALPVPLVVPTQPFTVTQGWTPGEAQALNAHVTNLQQQISLMQAVLTALDRAESATQAKDLYWEARQMQAAAGYFAEVTSLLEAQPTLLADLQAAFAASGRQYIIGRGEVIAYQDRIRLEGFSEQEKAILAALGATEEDINGLRRSIVVADEGAINALMGSGRGEFPDLLTAPKIIASIEDTATVLRAGPLVDFAPPPSLYLPLISSQ